MIQKQINKYKKQIEMCEKKISETKMAIDIIKNFENEPVTTGGNKEYQEGYRQGREQAKNECLARSYKYLAIHLEKLRNTVKKYSNHHKKLVPYEFQM